MTRKEISRKRSEKYLLSLLTRDESTELNRIRFDPRLNLLHPLITMKKKKRSGWARIYLYNQHTVVAFFTYFYDYWYFPYHV